MPEGAAQPFRVRSLALPVYLPTFLFAIGQGAVIPILPLFALELGASPAAAGAIVAARGIGTMAFDIPAGMLVSRIGDRGAMLVGTLLLAVVALGAGLSPSPAVFAPLIFVMGGGWAIWLLARLSYATEVSPIAQRGRVLALVGGSNRVGNFAGPFIGAGLAYFFGLEATFFLQAIVAGLAAATMFAFVTGTERDRDATGHGAAHTRLLRVVTEHRRVFATAGLATVAIQLLRSARQAIIPLWGDHVGLDASQISIIFGITTALDMSLFYPAGILMDRRGRKWAGVPCLIFMAAGMILVPLTGNFVTLMGAALVTGLGNGFGSGINMTLGADFSPAQGRGEFLGVWRLVADVGTAGGPVAIGALTAVGSLGVASVATGGIGLAGAVVMAWFVAEPLRTVARQPRPGE